MSWDAKYAAERAALAKKYPQYPTQFDGLAPARKAYQLGVLLNGSYLRARVETRRHRGRKITDVFGDWVVPQPAIARATPG